MPSTYFRHFTASCSLLSMIMKPHPTPIPENLRHCPTKVGNPLPSAGIFLESLIVSRILEIYKVRSALWDAWNTAMEPMIASAKTLEEHAVFSPMVHRAPATKGAPLLRQFGSYGMIR